MVGGRESRKGLGQVCSVSKIYIKHRPDPHRQMTAGSTAHWSGHGRQGLSVFVCVVAGQDTHVVLAKFALSH